MRPGSGRSGIGKYLLLALFLALFVGWYLWKQSYGHIGAVAKLSGSTHDMIAFVRTDKDGASNLYVVRSDGTDLMALTNDDQPKRMPAWSPDGSRLCFAQEARAEGTTTYQLYVLGSGAARQATYGSISKDMPSWRPDGKLIAFLSGGAIKVVSPNGTDVEQVYPLPRRGAGADVGVGTGQSLPDDAGDLRRPPITLFRWAPTGASLAGVQVMEGENAAVLGRSSWWAKPGSALDGPEGSTIVEPESIVVLPHLESEPFVLPGAETVSFDWYPDGRRLLAALSTRQGRHALIRFRTDEKNLPVEPVLTADANTMVADNPVVSPDGKQVAFELWRVKASGDRVLLGIAVTPSDDATPVVIRNANDVDRLPLVVRGDARTPRWSPDGTRLLYSMVGDHGRMDLYVAKADGSGPINLTKGEGDNTDAIWSPAKR